MPEPTETIPVDSVRGTATADAVPEHVPQQHWFEFTPSLIFGVLGNVVDVDFDDSRMNWPAK